ncbi:hypothetical protein ACF08M_16575 [Streptomyces sp. NPDC015032]|uniref:BACON domain-containing protein n=1 Tax=Streptomyces sp. NPDC015032 TaxID=3364937 RepID=UPI0036F7C75B
MTSSRLEPPTHTTGAHRTRRSAPHSSTQPSPQRPPARYEPHLDGLFTYCLSVLCDHDAATEALGGVLAIAERQDGRCPEGEEERKSWLYALARWMCLRKLAEQKQGRRAHRHKAGGTLPGGQQAKQPGRQPAKREREKKRAAGGPPGKQPSGTATQGARAGRRTPPAVAKPSVPFVPGDAPVGQAPAHESGAAAEAHRRELAQLAWPEAAGTTPEQREALELAVRHRLAPRAVASVLGLEPATARELLAAAACEVERTRAALAVVETGNCPTIARLTGDHRVLLSAALRRELVRHVDDCPRCRRAAERAGAEGPWPGAAVTPAAALPVVAAPRPSAYVAMVHAQRNRSGGPRFDRAGFPMDPKDHAARRDRLRARVVTTTLVATVVAAPVIALWAAYRGAPQTGEGHDGSSVTATETDAGHGPDGTPDGHYENAGNDRPRPGAPFGDGRGPDVSAEVISPGTAGGGSGGLTVEARSSGGTTLIRLTARGSAPVAWSARADASWLRLDNSSGTLAAGGSTTIRVLVDHLREPAGPWSARIALAPSGAVVAIRGHGTAAPSPGGPGHSGPPASSGPSVPSQPPSSPDPTRPTDPTPGPTGSTDPTPTPTDPEPSPDPTGPSTPTDPGADTGGSAQRD